MQTIQLIEHSIRTEQHRQITTLRNACFPEHQVPRSWYKQLPHFRFLVYDKEILVAHMGVDHRMISVDSQAVSIFGVIDFCVAQSHRGLKLASELLDKITELAHKNSVEFIFLLADDHRLYTKNGFRIVKADCSWLRINEHQNYGMAQEQISEELMIKQTGLQPWPDGAIDLLGYLF